MTTLNALEILDLATQPLNIARLTRADFTNINTALSVLYNALVPNKDEPEVADKSVKKTKKPKEEPSE